MAGVREGLDREFVVTTLNPPSSDGCRLARARKFPGT